MTSEPSFSSMFTSPSVRPGRSARSRKWSSCSTRSIAGVQRCATWLRSKRVLKSRSKSAASGSGRMRRAIFMTSYDEGNLTCRQCRYLSPCLSTLANADEAGIDTHGTKIEPRAEPVSDLADRVQMAARVGSVVARPPGDELVEPLPVQLLHDKAAARRHELGKVRAGLGQR